MVRAIGELHILKQLGQIILIFMTKCGRMKREARKNCIVMYPMNSESCDPSG